MLVFLLALGLPSVNTTRAISQGHWPLCHTLPHHQRRTRCVVDGDTLWLGGQKIRLADIDAPEVSQPRCDYERRLASDATDRLAALLSAPGPELRLAHSGTRTHDRYGRALYVVSRGGESIGDVLVREGLARRWTGRRQPWC